MKTYLATALYRRLEVTLDLVDLYVHANYLWRALTNACEVADHPDEDLSYWSETSRPGARSRQQLVEDVESEVLARHPYLESLLHAFPAREGDGPLSFRTWLRGFGPDETIRATINAATLSYIASLPLLGAGTEDGAPASATANSRQACSATRLGTTGAARASLVSRTTRRPRGAPPDP